MIKNIPVNVLNGVIIKVKTTILFISLIIILFAISSVSASDANETIIANDNTDLIGIENQDVNEIQTDEILKESPKTFTELDAAINGNSENDIYLDSDYTYNSESSFQSGININRAVTIHGNGHTIDGAGQARIFKVGNTETIIRDLIFINGNAPGTGNYKESGGAVSGSCTIINCTFTNNTARGSGACHGGYTGYIIDCTFENNTAIIGSGGGAIGGTNAINCTFINNKAGLDGGAMFGGGKAINCTFINNYAGSHGGAIINIDPTNCTFINNKAEKYGGAMYSLSSTLAENCTFINNTASQGGAAFAKSFENCIFINNSADYGGAMYEGYTNNCTFINNTATKYGGALVLSQSSSYVKGSKFINNSAPDGGAVYFSSSYGNGEVTNCEFINNTAANNGGAGYNVMATQCTFTNNTAANSGGAMYGGIVNLCTFKDNSAGNGDNDTTSGTTFNELTCFAENITTTYGSRGELLAQVFNSNNHQMDNIELLIKVYNGDSLVNTYNALSGESLHINLDAGTYTAVVNLKDESATPAVATIIVNKAASTLGSNAVTTVYTTNKYLVITLKDAQGKAVNGAKVSVNLNSAKTYKTDKKGQIKILVGNLVPKAYVAKITFNGNNNLLQSSKNVKVTVKKAKPKITAKKKTFKKSLKVKKYKITLKYKKNTC